MSFEQQSIQYLGFIVDQVGFHSDPAKVQGIANWPVPTIVAAFQIFLGGINFDRQFIFHFYYIARPLHQLYHQPIFTWTKSIDESGKNRKDSLIKPKYWMDFCPKKDFLRYTCSFWVRHISGTKCTCCWCLSHVWLKRKISSNLSVDHNKSTQVRMENLITKVLEDSRSKNM